MAELSYFSKEMMTNQIPLCFGIAICLFCNSLLPFFQFSHTVVGYSSFIYQILSFVFVTVFSTHSFKFIELIKHSLLLLHLSSVCYVSSKLSKHSSLTIYSESFTCLVLIVSIYFLVVHIFFTNCLLLTFWILVIAEPHLCHFRSLLHFFWNCPSIHLQRRIDIIQQFSPFISFLTLLFYFLIHCLIFKRHLSHFRWVLSFLFYILNIPLHMSIRFALNTSYSMSDYYLSLKTYSFIHLQKILKQIMNSFSFSLLS